MQCFPFSFGKVSDTMLTNASFVFPDNTPVTKEAYYYRTIFEKFFPKVMISSALLLLRLNCLDLCSDLCVSWYINEQSAARATVPGGPSVACSTAKAVEWDAAWSQNLDPSGRAALGVHVAAYEGDKTEDPRPEKLQKLADKTAASAWGLQGLS